MNLENFIFSLKHCILLYNQSHKYIHIITWLSLNHPSLLVGYVSNSVKHEPRNTLWMPFLSFSDTHGARSTVYAAAAVQNSQRFPKLWLPEARS